MKHPIFAGKTILFHGKNAFLMATSPFCMAGSNCFTSGRVPSAYIVSIDDTEKKQMLWNRADSNIEPSVYDQSAPAASTSSPKAASVTLVARDDRDLGDEADASSGRPDASAAADDSATSTARKRDQAEVSRSAADEQAEQPPSRLNPVLVIARYA